LTEDGQEKAEARAEKPKEGFFKRSLAGPRRFCDLGWEFSKELWNDHQFWVNAVAVKGGAAALLGGAVVAISFAFTYPFIITAGIILLCGTTMTLGGIGIIAGCSRLWETLKDTWYKTTGKEPPPAPAEKKKTLLERLRDKPSVQKILNDPLARKFFASPTWQALEKIKGKQEKLLNSLAIGGSVAYTGLGIWILAAQIVALPVVALPMLVTAAAVAGASYAISGSVGLWISLTNLFDKRREKKASAETGEAPQAEAKSPSVPQVPPQQEPLLPPRETRSPEKATAAESASQLKEEFETARAEPAHAEPANDDRRKVPPARAPGAK
jgi:hypothetical protein